jgi:hypothetical protein
MHGPRDIFMTNGNVFHYLANGKLSHISIAIFEDSEMIKYHHLYGSDLEEYLKNGTLQTSQKTSQVTENNPEK